MQKRLNKKLALNKETLRTLTHQDMDQVNGGGTTTTGGSGLTDTCGSCVTCAVTERVSICVC